MWYFLVSQVLVVGGRGGCVGASWGDDDDDDDGGRGVDDLDTLVPLRFLFTFY